MADHNNLPNKQEDSGGDAKELTVGPLSMKQKDNEKRMADDGKQGNMILRLFGTDIGYKILRLFGTDIRVPSYKLDNNSSDHSLGIVLNPLPLRQFNPKQGILRDYGDEKKTGKRKSENDDAVSVRKKRKPLKKRVNFDDLPLPSLDGFTRIQSILQEHGMKPKFLYRKWIEESDINKDLNRLLLSKSESLMNIMTEEERMKMVTEKDGLEVCGFDSEGRDYTLHFKKWKSQSQPILNKGSWRDLVNNNNVEEGQMIEIWGERKNEELVFIVNFRKAEAEEVQSNAGSSSSSSSSSSSPDLAKHMEEK